MAAAVDVVVDIVRVIVFRSELCQDVKTFQARSDATVEGCDSRREIQTILILVMIDSGIVMVVLADIRESESKTVIGSESITE